MTTTATSGAQVRQPDAAPSAAAPAVAAELLATLSTVVRRLRHAPLPLSDEIHAAWSDAPPAPRHVAALMQVVASGTTSVTALAERLGVSLATASQVVTDLEAVDLVERADDPTDRRRTLVRVPESSRAVADAVLDTRLLPVQRALDRMRPSEQRTVLRGLVLIAEELGKPHR